VGESDVLTTLEQLVQFYEDRCGGFRLHYLKRLGYQFQTSPDAGAVMERMFASRPRPISRAALETLSIIAYRQPVTRAEVEFIRGVDAGSIFKTLLERELIKCVGRKEIIGRPMLFGTSDQFLTVFNLSSIKDLPSLESFQPARDMVQGAMARIEGAHDEIVDVEEYIADSTRGEYEGDDLALTSAGEVDQDDQFVEKPEVDDGSDAHTEVAVPAGDSVTPGGGGLDQ
jgi:segregation and condensation protein B